MGISRRSIRECVILRSFDALHFHLLQVLVCCIVVYFANMIVLPLILTSVDLSTISSSASPVRVGSNQNELRQNKCSFDVGDILTYIDGSICTVIYVHDGDNPLSYTIYFRDSRRERRATADKLRYALPQEIPKHYSASVKDESARNENSYINSTSSQQGGSINSPQEEMHISEDYQGIMEEKCHIRMEAKKKPTTSLSFIGQEVERLNSWSTEDITRPAEGKVYIIGIFSSTQTCGCFMKCFIKLLVSPDLSSPPFFISSCLLSTFTWNVGPGGQGQDYLNLARVHKLQLPFFANNLISKPLCVLCNRNR